MTTKKSQKVLVPLATLLVAGAVAIGSGATWTSTTGTGLSVTSGTLLHTNDRDGLTLTVGDLKPGDVLSGTLTIANTGSLDSTLTMAETTSSSGFAAGGLNLKISQGATVVYDGDFGGLSTAPVALGQLNQGASTSLTFEVSIPSTDTGTANQGKSADATYQFVTTQLPGQSLTGQWL
jgi:hypothetical protein